MDAHEHFVEAVLATDAGERCVSIALGRVLFDGRVFDHFEELGAAARPLWDSMDPDARAGVLARAEAYVNRSMLDKARDFSEMTG